MLVLWMVFKLGKGSKEARTAAMRAEAAARFRSAEKKLQVTTKDMTSQDTHQGNISRRGARAMFVGSSTFTFWTHIDRDMAPVGCLNLAFGGSITNDLLDHIDYFTSYLTRDDDQASFVIVYYCGANDISLGQTPRETADGFFRFVQAMERRVSNKQLKIVYVSIIAGPWQRYLERDSAALAANKLVEEFIMDHQNHKKQQQEDKSAKSTTRLAYVDVNRDERFRINWDWYLNDGLHLNDEGHIELGKAILPTVQRMIETQ